MSEPKKLTSNELSSRPNTIILTPESRPDLAKIMINTDGMMTYHNMPCAICGDETAVVNQSDGTFSPCWKCQNKKYFTLQVKSRFIRWMLNI